MVSSPLISETISALELLAAPEIDCFVIASGDGAMQRLLEKVLSKRRRSVRVAVRGNSARRAFGLATDTVFYDDWVAGLDPKAPNAKVAEAVKEFGPLG